MGPIEICLIIFLCLSCGAILATYIYKKIKHIPTGDCGCCYNNAKKIRKKIMKQHQKERNKKCCCQNNSNCDCKKVN